MQVKPSHDFTDDVPLLDDEMDGDLEAWTTQDVDEFGTFGVSRLTGAAD